MTYPPLGSSHQIICCEERLAEFCGRAKYDPPGRKLALENPDMITKEQVDLMNSRAMNARSPKASWQPFFNNPIAELSVVPKGVDLIDADDSTYGMARQKVEALYQLLIACKGITDMSASKLIYLHRPKLIAISDSYARERLSIPQARRKWGRGREWYVRRGLGIMDAVRDCGLRNTNVLTQLSQYARTLTYKDGTKVDLAKSRILDIYMWTEQAASNHRDFWSAWYQNHQAKCSRKVSLDLTPSF